MFWNWSFGNLKVKFVFFLKNFVVFVVKLYFGILVILVIKILIIVNFNFLKNLNFVILLIGFNVFVMNFNCFKDFLLCNRLRCRKCCFFCWNLKGKMHFGILVLNYLMIDFGYFLYLNSYIKNNIYIKNKFFILLNI